MNQKNLNAIEWLKQIPRVYQEKPFLIDAATREVLTFGELENKAITVACNLQEQGLLKGDRIALLLPNSVHHVLLNFAALSLGLVVVPINKILSQEEIVNILEHSRSCALIVSSETFGQMPSSFLATSSVKVLSLDEPSTGEVKISILSLDGTQPTSQTFEAYDNLEEEDEFLITYTSGTTAHPKAVVHHVGNLIDNERLFTKSMGIDSEKRFYHCFSMGTLAGYHNTLMLPYICGASVVLTKEFGPMTIRSFWDNIKEFEVNTIWFVPTIMSILLQMDRGTTGVDYCQKNNVLSLVGMAPLPQTIRQDFEKKYHLKVYENYGLSETLFLANDYPGLSKKEGALGEILPGIEVKILDDRAQEMPIGEKGEIYVNTPHLMKGYYQNFEQSYSNPVENGWFTTGDIGRLLDDRQIAVEDRKKDLIIRGGYNISPVAVENVLYHHPCVVECAVLGIQDDLKGEKIYALIQTDESRKTFDEIKQELIQLCQDHLSPISIPDEIEELPQFPRTGLGKIQKQKIREWLKEGKAFGHARVSPGLPEKAYFQPSNIVSNASEALSVNYNNQVYEMKREGKDITTLSLGEAFFDIPLYPFDDLPFPDIYHYTHSRGILQLREKLAEYFQKTYEVSFDPENEIIVTGGSKIAVYMALLALINPGDEVIIPDPSWVSYPEQVKLCHGIPVTIPYDESIFEYEAYITNRTRLIIINNPNNPSGKIYSLEEISFLYSLARKYNLYVLSDEAYSDFLLEKEKFVSLGNLDPEKRNLILVNSISKNYGISGWRIGYVITNSKLTYQILKLNQHLVTCPPSILAFYIAKHFDDIIKITMPQIHNLIERRRELETYMKEIGLKHLPGEATFYFFVSISPSLISSTEFCDNLLAEHNIGTVPGIGYGPSCDRFIRVSVGTEDMTRTKSALFQIKTLINQTA